MANLSPIETTAEAPVSQPKFDWAALRLSIRAMAILIAFGVGAGVLGVPGLVAQAGIGVSLLVLGAGLFASLTMHLWVGRVAGADPKRRQLAELIEVYALNSKYAAGGILIFGLFVVGNMGLMAGYLDGVVSVVAGSTSLSQGTAKWGAFAFLCFLSMLPRAHLSVLQVLGSVVLAGGLLIMVAAVEPMAGAGILALPNHFGKALPLLSVAMFCLTALFAVPQAVEALGERKDLIRRSVIGGQLGTAFILLIVCLLTFLVTTEVPDIAILAWAEGLPPWLSALGPVFALTALITSYVGTHHAVAKMLEDRLAWPSYVTSLAVIWVVLALSLIPGSNFVFYLKLAGGMTAFLVTALIIPALRRVEAFELTSPLHKRTPVWLIVLVIFAYCCMALGSIL